MLASLFISPDAIKVPQPVAYLAPLIKNNKIVISGTITLQNASETSFSLGEIALVVKDEGGGILSSSRLDWESTTVASGATLNAPVDIELEMKTLQHDQISVILSTAVTYKKFALRIPLENKVAVVELGELKDSIRRPLQIHIQTRFYSDIFRNVSVSYELGITNPISVDLLLEEGTIRIYTQGAGDIAVSELGTVVFRADEEAKISGSIDLERMFSVAVLKQFTQKEPIRIEIKGKLKIPDTDIAMPFTIESVQSFDLVF